MEVKLVGWTTGASKFPDADSFVSDVERQQFFFLSEKAIKADIVKNKWKFSGEHHQNGKCGMPVISVDGCIGVDSFSWRAWGFMMAESWNEIEQTKKYHYLDFYMTPSLEESRYAKEEYKL